MANPNRSVGLSILVLADPNRKQAQNLLDHVGAFGRYSKHRVTVYNPRYGRSHEQLDLGAFDVVVVHWSLLVISDEYVSSDLREKIRRFNGLKIQFLQDEYRWVDEITAMVRFLEIDALFTVVPPEAAQKLYASRLPGVEIVPTYAGFVPEDLSRRQTQPIARRPIDVGYRGRATPPWLGRLAYEKLEIGRGFLERARSTQLRCDIAWTEHDRVYGERWVRFLASCKATLGTESGASIADFDRSVERAAENYLAYHPAASFEELQRNVLAPYEGNVIINVISPRVLEAAALRTALVLFPGSYSDAVRPWHNYIPLEKDFSNFDEVVAALEDVPALQEMSERTYEELVASEAFSLSSFIREFDEFVSTHGSSVATSSRSGYWRSRANHAIETRTLFGVAVPSARRGLMRTALVTRLLAGDHELRSFAVDLVRDRRLREKFGLHRIASDVVRLGVVRRAHLGRPITRQHFGVVPRLDENGALTFVTHPRRAWRTEATTTREEVESAVRNGDVSTVAWNNLAGGPVFSFRTLRGHDFNVVVGYLGINGIYQFGPLTQLVREHPQRALPVLTALAEAPRQWLGPRWYSTLPRPIRRWIYEARRTIRIERPMWVVVLESPIAYAATAGMLVYVVVRHRPIRRVVWAVLSDERTRPAVGTRALAKDALLLHLLRRARGRQIATIARVEPSTRGDVLRFSSRANYRPTDEHVSLEGIEHVLWSHSEIGPDVFYPIVGAKHLRIAVGRRGTHEFRSLRALLRNRPELVVDVLEPHVRLWWRAALASPRPYAATAGLVVSAVVRHGTIRRVAWAVLSDERTRAEVGARALARDVLLLHLLRRARNEEIGTIARVEPSTRGDVLRFSSRANDGPTDEHVSLEGIEHVLWSHREIGSNISYPVFGAGYLRIAVGRRGTHEFPSLRALLRNRPELVEGLFAPPTRLVDRLAENGPLPIALRPILLPADTAARTLVIFRAALFDPVTRRAAVRALRHAGALPDVLRDLTRLHALRQALANRIPEIRAVEIDRSRPDRPRFVSVPADTAGRPDQGQSEATEPDGPTWDNSAVGTSVFVPFLHRRLAFSLGTDGVWEFRAFAAEVSELANGRPSPGNRSWSVSLPWRA